MTSVGSDPDVARAFLGFCVEATRALQGGGHENAQLRGLLLSLGSGMVRVIGGRQTLAEVIADLNRGRGR